MTLRINGLFLFLTAQSRKECTLRRDQAKQGIRTQMRGRSAHDRTTGVLTLLVLSTLLLALPPAHAQTEIVLYNFCSQLNCVDGDDSASSLMPDGAGNFYGTTQLGGAHEYGAVF